MTTPTMFTDEKSWLAALPREQALRISLLLGELEQRRLAASATTNPKLYCGYCGRHKPSPESECCGRFK